MPWVRFSTFPFLVNLVVFTAAGLVVWFAGVRLSTYADAVAIRTRLSHAFLGIALLGVATSLAEVATKITAASIGNADLVSGNLGLVVTCIFLIGLLERRDRTVLGMGVDSLAVLITYIIGLGGLYYVQNEPGFDQ